MAGANPTNFTTGSTLTAAQYDTAMTALNAAITRSISTISAATTLAAVASTDYVYFLNTGGVPTLPTAVSNTNQYVLKNITTTAIVVSTTSSQTIDGSTTYSLAAGASITLYSDNANWRIV